MNQSLAKRLSRLEQHLKAENPVLLDVLPTYYKFDKLLYRLGLLPRDTSLAVRISWWPLISVLGTFSSGKSTFINSYIGEKIQSTGNQAVDDKFTVICHRTSDTEANRTLPGTALDADPRFPFYRISTEIEKVAQGEGKHIESYLQLRTTANNAIQNKIIIDSPGFDSDEQRRSTLKITDHIIDLSDLVLVFFDARHPEPGAMQDTLQHLVANTVRRTDASKFLYILNQMDTAATEDNPEEIFGAWQRSLAQAGLSAGQFFTIYDENAAVKIENVQTRERFQTKRDADLARIRQRIDEVELHRNYRIAGFLETLAKEMEHDVLPKLQQVRRRWRRLVALTDAVALGVALAITAALAVVLNWTPPEGMFSLEWLVAHWVEAAAVAVAVLVMVWAIHFWARNMVRKRLAKSLPETYGEVDLNLRASFLKGTRWFRTIFRKQPPGWGRRGEKRLRAIRETVAAHIQALNDRYADPSAKSPPVSLVAEDPPRAIEAS